MCFKCKGKINLLVSGVSMFIFLSFSRADVYTVTNTQNSGAGSLRQAINDANSHTGPDTIYFNISDTDPGFDASQGVWIIKPEEHLPIIQDDSTMIRAETQTKNQGDQNPDGPEIMLYGSLLSGTTLNNGFSLSSAGNVITGFIISGFPKHGISISGEGAFYNKIQGNFIGTNAGGNDTLSNKQSGILIGSGAKYNVIGGLLEYNRNVVSGNYYYGISIYSADSNEVIGNYIGTDASGMQSVANQDGIFIYEAEGNKIGGASVAERNVIAGNSTSGISITKQSSRGNMVLGNYIGINVNGTAIIKNEKYGVSITNGAGVNVIGGLATGEENIISGSGWYGILIENAGSDSNQVMGNIIGPDANGEYFDDPYRGILIRDGAQYNLIGSGNIIKYHRQTGILIEGSTSLYNTITQNTISGNDEKGISLNNGGNNDLESPVITSVNSVSGTAPLNATVEIFSDSLDEGMHYEATVTADESGNFTWSGTPQGPKVTATATDEDGNTSEFSDAVTVTAVETADKQIPEQYFLSQNYPNPFNPETTIQFGVKKPCQVVLTVYNLLGKEVERLVDEYNQPGEYEISFKVKGYTSGIYVYKIQMGSFQAVRKMVVLE